MRAGKHQPDPLLVAVLAVTAALLVLIVVLLRNM
jgi:hypothetical protein